MKAAVIGVLLLVSFVSPSGLAAQERVQFGLGAGSSFEFGHALYRLNDLHVLATVQAATPVDGVHVRIDGMRLQWPDQENATYALASLVFSPSAFSLAPYLIAGAGTDFRFGRRVILSGGIGIAPSTVRLPLFLEVRAFEALRDEVRVSLGMRL